MEQNILEILEYKKAELLQKEKELACLEQELNAFQDKESQVKLIEASLESKYVKQREQNLFDKAQESEISNAIKTKGSDVTKALKKYKSNEEAASKKLHEFMSKNKKPSKYYPNELKVYNTKLKAQEKAYGDVCKAAAKECISELKRVFGELEIDTKRFCKNGISRINLTRLVGIMDKIYVEGSKIGTIPLSYQQKVYKLKQIINETPEDLEKKHKEDEKEAKKVVLDKLNSEKKAYDKSTQRYSELKKEYTKNSKAYKKIVETLQDAEQQHDIDVSEAINKSEEKVNKYKKVFETERESILEIYEQNKSNLQTRIDNETNIISDLKTQISQLEQEKDIINDELIKLSVFSVGKKKELRGRLSDIDKYIYYYESEIFSHHQQKDRYGRECPEYERDEKIRVKESKLNDALKKEKINLEIKLKAIDKKSEDIHKKIDALQTLIRAEEKDMTAIEKTEARQKEAVNKLEEKAKSFHVEYMLTTYGKEFEFSRKAKETKVKIRELSKEVIGLKKEISSLEKEAQKQEAAMKQQLEEERKLQIERAKEEERKRKEQQAIKQRIQKELKAQEKEQKTIDAGLDVLTSLPEIMQALEENADHEFLKESSCPVLDDGKRTITNGIVRKRYEQKSVIPQCEKYLLLFVDQQGNAVSEPRLIQQKAIGEKTPLSFELKAAGGFNGGNYYLMYFNFDTGEVICAEKYTVNLSFVNDFDF